MSLFKDLFKEHETPKNPDLERAMGELAHRDNAQTLICVSSGNEGRNGKRTAANRTRVAFKTVENPSGTILLPAFTGAEALTSWVGSEAERIALPARELFQSSASSNIQEVRVNPSRQGRTISRPGGNMTRAEYVALARGLTPEPMNANTSQLNVPAGQQLLVGATAEHLSREVLQTVKSYLRRFPKVQNAFLFQISSLLDWVIPPGMFIDFMGLETGPMLMTFGSFEKLR